MIRQEIGPSWDSSAPIQSATENRSLIKSFIKSKELRDAVSQWDHLPRTFGSDTAADLEWLDGFSLRHWDFRQGRERDEINKIELTPDRVAAVNDLVAMLGLTNDGAVSTETTADTIVVLGGLVRACVTRTAFAARLSETSATVRRVVCLAGHRDFSVAEKGLATRIGITATTEFDALSESSARFFGASSEPVRSRSDAVQTFGSWSIDRFDGFPLVEVVSAPSADPLNRRANTAETIEWWLASDSAREVRNVVVVTNPIYLQYQGATSVQWLGIEGGRSVRIATVDRLAADLGPETQTFGPQHYAQELRSTIRGYRGFWDALERYFPGDR